MPRVAFVAGLALLAWSARAHAGTSRSTITAIGVTSVPQSSAGAAPASGARSAPARTSATAAAHGKPKRRKLPPPPPPAAELYAINTKETFHLRPDGKGRFGPHELRGWSHFLRCHHTGRQHFMSTRLAALIYQVDKHFDFKRIVVVAGYRAPRIAREKGNPKSPHKKGVACDFRIDGIANTELRDYERTLSRVGVGFYPNSDFVHLDVDPSRAKHNGFWIDYSGPGQRAQYSKDPSADLANEREESDELDSTSPAGSTAGGADPQTGSSLGAPAPATGLGINPSN